MNYKEIADLIGNAKKSTPVKVYVCGQLTTKIPDDIMVFQGMGSCILIGDYALVKSVLNKNKHTIKYVHIENDRRNSALPLLDVKDISARIEPGAIIRDKVTIGNDCIIMMGAVINIAAEIGARTMIDMNAVIGARGIIGKDCHIGAGAVIAGVLEPPSAAPVIIGDRVLIGANAVILEGVIIGANSVIAAGAVVTKDVKPNSVMAGVPATLHKMRDAKTDAKTELVDILRKI